MEAADTRQYVAQLITKQLQQESFQLKPEQVHTPACAIDCATSVVQSMVCFVISLPALTAKL